MFCFCSNLTPPFFFSFFPFYFVIFLLFYFKVKLGRQIYLLIAKPGAILITKWAAHPFNRFMEVKEIPLEQEYVSMNLHEMPEGEPVLFLGVKKGFQIIELDGGTSIDVIIDDSLIPDKGTTVGTVAVDKGVLLCFSEFAFPVTVTGQPIGSPFKWRNAINTVCRNSIDSLPPLCRRVSHLRFSLFFPPFS